MTLGDHGNQWLRGDLDLELSADQGMILQVIIEGHIDGDGLTNDYKSDMAIDDILIFDRGSCSQNAGNLTQNNTVTPLLQRTNKDNMELHTSAVHPINLQTNRPTHNPYTNSTHHHSTTSSSSVTPRHPISTTKSGVETYNSSVLPITRKTVIQGPKNSVTSSENPGSTTPRIVRNVTTSDKQLLECPPSLRALTSVGTGLAEVELSQLNGGIGNLRFPVGVYYFDAMNCTTKVIVSGNTWLSEKTHGRVCL